MRLNTVTDASAVKCRRRITRARFQASSAVWLKSALFGMLVSVGYRGIGPILEGQTGEKLRDILGYVSLQEDGVNWRKQSGY